MGYYAILDRTPKGRDEGDASGVGPPARRVLGMSLLLEDKTAVIYAAGGAIGALSPGRSRAEGGAGSS